MAARENRSVALYSRYRASGSDREIAANQFHSYHVPRLHLRIFRGRLGGTTGHHAHSPAGELFAELRDRIRIKPGGNQRRLDGNQKLSLAGAGASRKFLRQG